MRSFIQRARVLIVATSAVVLVPAVWADHHEHKDHKNHQDSAVSSSQSSGMTTGPINGEVRRIDTENRKLTIKHEAIPELDMAAMTMVFGVADTIALDQLKAGDKIRFSIKKSEGKWQVMTIEN